MDSLNEPWKFDLLPCNKAMASTQNESVKIEKPTVLITIGMAGSGKTNFMQVK